MKTNNYDRKAIASVATLIDDLHIVIHSPWLPPILRASSQETAVELRRQEVNNLRTAGKSPDAQATRQIAINILKAGDVGQQANAFRRYALDVFGKRN